MPIYLYFVPHHILAFDLVSLVSSIVLSISLIFAFQPNPSFKRMSVGSTTTYYLVVAIVFFANQQILKTI